MMAAAADDLKAERQRLVEKDYIDPVAAAVMYRLQLHTETEVRWHDEFAKILADLPEETVETIEPRSQPRAQSDSEPSGPQPPDTA
jgi:hypothetical protein